METIDIIKIINVILLSVTLGLFFLFMFRKKGYFFYTSLNTLQIIFFYIIVSDKLPVNLTNYLKNYNIVNLYFLQSIFELFMEN